MSIDAIDNPETGGDEGVAYDAGFQDGFAHAEFVVSEYWTIATSPRFCASESEALKLDALFRLIRAHLSENRKPKEQLELIVYPEGYSGPGEEKK